MNLFNSRRESELASITSYKYVPIAHLVGNIFHVFSSVPARKISNFLDLDWTVWGCVCLFSSLRNNKSNYSLKERKSYFLTFALWGKGFVSSCLADWKNDWELQTKLPPSSGQWTKRLSWYFQNLSSAPSFLWDKSIQIIPVKSGNVRTLRSPLWLSEEQKYTGQIFWTDGYGRSYFRKGCP